MKQYKLYNSKNWLLRQFFDLKKTPKEIAISAACSEKTILRKLKEAGAIK